MIEKARDDPAVNIAPWRRLKNAHTTKVRRGGMHDVALLKII
jgi:hypothetical protein